MKSTTLVTLTAALLVPLGAAHAQTGKTAKPASAKPTPAKKVVKTKKKATPPAAKAAAATAAAAPAQAPNQPLTEKELAVAALVHTGQIPCELGASVNVSPDDKNPGFFHVRTGKHAYYMHPVESRTGAIRMEDNRAGAMWLQLGNKSMLLNQTLGQRVADECAAPSQLEFAARMKTQPQTSLLGDVKN